ncbi:MAG: SpoIIE family protein phosphatase [Spirochaetes bacterium]|nr:SpoIIE family protein phosphatase [Spirochaetota bacterium]
MFFASLVAALISSIVLVFTAFFVLFKNRGNQSPIYYFYYNICGAGLMFSFFLAYYLNDSPYLTQINRMSQVATLLFTCSLLNLSLTYPEREKKVKFYVPLLISIPAFIMSAVVYFTDLSLYNVHFENLKLTRGMGPVYNYYALLVIIYFVVAIGIFIYNYINIRIETYRLQIRYVILITSIFISLSYVGSLLLPRMFNYYDLYVLGPASVTTVATVTLFYSIIAHNVMDIRTAIHKTVMYATLSLVVFIPIIAILYLKSSGKIAAGNEVTAGSLVIIFSLFTLFLQPMIDSAFRKRAVDIEYMTNRFIQRASQVKTLGELVKTGAFELHNGMALSRSLFFVYNDEKRMFVKIFDTAQSAEDEMLDRTFPLIHWFTRNQDILPVNRIYTDEESFRGTRSLIAPFFTRYNISAILPIYYENRIYGMLCLGMKENTSSITPDEIEKLEEFRIRLNEFIVTTLAYDAAKKDQFISRSLELSEELLQCSAAPALPELKNIRFSSLVSPKYATGTDYYDFIQPSPDSIGILFSDVSGIGINNALYSVILRSVFHSCAGETASPSMIIKRINLVLHEYTKGGGELATAFYAYYDTKSRRLSYTNAGFPPMDLFRIDKNDFDTLDTEGFPLGYDPGSEFGTGRTELKTGDIGVVYSKSFINSKNSNGENFGLLRLRSIIRELKSRNPSEIAKNLNYAYEKFMGISQPDSDITVLIMKIV